ncbi:MAG: DUF2845 domain-containing protein [Steroidobacteraceae bacterium]|nr:DUF2845 domain-containing protein [Steroidobacteraceae bacterium]
MKLHFVVLTLVATLVAAPSRAETLRCGNVLIQPGDSASYVLARCGEPNAREQITEPVFARRPNGTTYQVGTTTREIWRYERRRGQFPARLTFEGGELKKLEYDRGSRS